MSSVFARLENSVCSSASNGGRATLTGSLKAVEGCESAEAFVFEIFFFLLSGAEKKSISDMGAYLTFFIPGKKHLYDSDVHDILCLYLVCASKVNRSVAT